MRTNLKFGDDRFLGKKYLWKVRKNVFRTAEYFHSEKRDKATYFFFSPSLLYQLLIISYSEELPERKKNIHCKLSPISGHSSSFFSSPFSSSKLSFPIPSSFPNNVNRPLFVYQNLLYIGIISFSSVINFTYSDSFLSIVFVSFYFFRIHFSSVYFLLSFVSFVRLFPVVFFS